MDQRWVDKRLVNSVHKGPFRFPSRYMSSSLLVHSLLTCKDCPYLTVILCLRLWWATFANIFVMSDILSGQLEFHCFTVSHSFSFYQLWIPPLFCSLFCPCSFISTTNKASLSKLVTNLVCSRAKKCINDEKRKNRKDRYKFCFFYFHLYPVATGSA